MQQKTIRNYTVKFEPNGEGGYIVDVPAFPQICTEGWTIEEALANAREAISLCVEYYLEQGRPLPKDVNYKAVERPKFFKLEVAGAK